MKSYAHLLTKTFLQGYTSGMRLYIRSWDEFLKYQEITNLRHALLIYKAPTETIIDLLN
jgi:hypothetical protein